MTEKKGPKRDDATAPKKRRPHWIIQFAKSLGYSPTAKQATEINCRLYAHFAGHFGGKPPTKHLRREDHPIFNQCLKQAIEDVMTHKGLAARIG